MIDSIGVLFGFIGLITAGHGAPEVHRAGWTLVGTTVDLSGTQAVPNVRVALFPDSAVTTSDSDGDFVLPWSGGRGWLTLVADTPGPDGQPWCKRVTIHSSEREPPSRIRDLGMIRITPRARLAYATVPGPPYDRHRPAVLRLPPPRAGEPDTCRLRVAFQVDLWGRIRDVRLEEATASSAALRDSVVNWYRQFDWVVPAETSCEKEVPFSGEDEIGYAWADSAWVLLPPLSIRGERRRGTSAPEDAGQGSTPR